MNDGAREFVLDIPKVQDIIKSSNLTKKQKQLFITNFKEEVKTTKSHFKDGAWDLDLNLMLSDFYVSVLGFEPFMIKAALCANTDTTLSMTHRGVMMTNNKPKVFLNTKANKLYVATRAKNADWDTQLGDL